MALNLTDERTRKVELLISNLLRIGVVASLFVIVFGTALSFVHHPEYLRSKQELARLTRPGAAFPQTPRQVWAGLRAMEGRAFVVLGLLLLVATPVMRVAVSVFAFVYERDAAFVIITAVVLTLLVVSFFLGRVE